jgi:hypothetical protein
MFGKKGKGKNKTNPARTEKKPAAAIKTPAKKQPPSGARQAAPQAQRPPADRNVSARYPNGRTIKTQDKHLPQEKNKVKELKGKRWAVIVDSNRLDELAVVRLTGEDTPNTTPLPKYKKGNGRVTYFKHFVEIKDAEGNSIKIDGQRFIENPWIYDLSKQDVERIRKKVFSSVKQSGENKKKRDALKKRGDK